MQHPSTRAQTRMFSASEIAEFEYCPLAWWHEQFEPWVHVETEELFARLVELEHEHGTQAPGLPEYRLIEGLLLRSGAFDEGQRQHQEHAEAVDNIEEEIEEELRSNWRVATRGQVLLIAMCILGVLAFLLIGFSWFLH